MKELRLLLLGTILFAGQAFGSSITQGGAMGGSFFQMGNSPAGSSGTWTWRVERFSDELGSLQEIVFEADIHGSFSSFEYNPFELPLSHTPGLTFGLTFFDHSYFFGGIQKRFSGASVMLDPGQGADFTAAFNQTFRYTFGPTEFASYIGTGSGSIYASPYFFGLNSFGTGGGEVNIDTRLIYIFGDQSTATTVPDRGNAILLLASAISLLAGCSRFSLTCM